MEIPHLESYSDYSPSNKLLVTNGSKKIKSQYYKKPLISVITIVLNAEQTIEKTIKSVINQSYENYEFIIIDGLSTDRTVEIIKNYNYGISKWISEKDKGSIDAANKGVTMAEGDLIFILCGDDWIKENTLQAIVDGFNYRKEISFVYGDMIMLSKGVEDLHKGNHDYKKNIKKGNPKFNYPVMAWRKNIFVNIGLYTPSYKWNNDYEFLIRIYKNNYHGEYIKNFSVFRNPGGQGELNITESFKDILRINYFYNLPLFIPGVFMLLQITRIKILNYLKKIRDFLR